MDHHCSLLTTDAQFRKLAALLLASGKPVRAYVTEMFGMPQPKEAAQALCVNHLMLYDISTCEYTFYSPADRLAAERWFQEERRLCADGGGLYPHRKGAAGHPEGCQGVARQPRKVMTAGLGN